MKNKNIFSFALYLAGTLLAATILAVCNSDDAVKNTAKKEQKDIHQNESSGSQKAYRVFKVTSSSFYDEATLPAEHTCEGKPFASGYSPQLEWSSGPTETQSYAIVFADETLIQAGMPDYAYHWAIWNIPFTQTNLPEGIAGMNPEDPDAISELPASLGPAVHTQARGIKQFFGPCPSWRTYCTNGDTPRSTDRYTFTVYALPNQQLDVPDYDPTLNSNYVDTLNAFFQLIALDSAVISTTSSAQPTSLPFACPE